MGAFLGLLKIHDFVEFVISRITEILALTLFDYLNYLLGHGKRDLLLTPSLDGVNIAQNLADKPSQTTHRADTDHRAEKVQTQKRQTSPETQYS